MGAQQKFHISLTKAQGNLQQFTLGIAEQSSAAMHFLHLKDRMDETSLGLYCEVCELGGVRLIAFVLLDASPRALRIALLEPGSQRCCQLVVLDACNGPEVIPFPDASPARRELLAAHRDNFVVPPVVANSTVATIDDQATRSQAAEPSPETKEAAAAIPPKSSKIIHRATRKLPSGQPVVLSVVREVLSDGAVRFRVIMYHPGTAQEVGLLLLNPLLDKVLAAAGLHGGSLGTSAEEVDAARKEVVAQIPYARMCILMVQR